MTETNGDGPTLTDNELREYFEAAIFNNQITANAFASRIGYWNRVLDPERNIRKECGYPLEAIDILQYKLMYERDPIAARVVEVLPMESWQVQPSIYEDEDSETETEFEKAWKELHQSIHTLTGTKTKNSKQGSWYQDDEGSLIWDYLLRLDIQSGIGHYGVMLLGIDDGKPLYVPVEGFEDLDSEAYMGTEAQYGTTNPFDSPAVGYDTYTTEQIKGESTPRPDQISMIAPMTPGQEPGSEGKRKLLYLRIFDEKTAQVTRYERDPHNPRFGLPVMYLITFNDQFNTQINGSGLPVASTNVHWSRVIHFADKRGINEAFAYPRMQQVFDRLIDLGKTYGAAGEGFWQMAFTILSGETHPQLGGDVKIDMAGINTQAEAIRTRLKRHLVSAGMTWKTLAPEVTDPTPFKDAFIEAICILLGCPKRVFMGSERGELASSQDDSAWNDRLRHRQVFTLTPRMIVPFIDRLIQLGVLPEPVGYSVVWPDLEALSDKDKATIAYTKTQAMDLFSAHSPESMMTPTDWYVDILGMDSEKANQIVESAQEAADQEDQMSPALQPEEETEPEPVTLKPGESLIHPQTGQKVASVPAKENK